MLVVIGTDYIGSSKSMRYDITIRPRRPLKYITFNHRYVVYSLPRGHHILPQFYSHVEMESGHM
jgi:hypothetical protein